MCHFTCHSSCPESPVLPVSDSSVNTTTHNPSLVSKGQDPGTVWCCFLELRLFSPFSCRCLLLAFAERALLSIYLLLTSPFPDRSLSSPALLRPRHHPFQSPRYSTSTSFHPHPFFLPLIPTSAQTSALLTGYTILPVVPTYIHTYKPYGIDASTPYSSIQDCHHPSQRIIWLITHPSKTLTSSSLILVALVWAPLVASCFSASRRFQLPIHHT